MSGVGSHWSGFLRTPYFPRVKLSAGSNWRNGSPWFPNLLDQCNCYSPHCIMGCAPAGCEVEVHRGLSCTLVLSFSSSPLGAPPLFSWPRRRPCQGRGDGHSSFHPRHEGTDKSLRSLLQTHRRRQDRRLRDRGGDTGADSRRVRRQHRVRNPKSGPTCCRWPPGNEGKIPTKHN